MARTPANVPFFTNLVLSVKDPFDSGSSTDMGGTAGGWKISFSDSGEPVYYDEEAQPINIPLGETTEILVVEFREMTAAILALCTPGATVSGNVVTHGGRTDRRIVAISAVATLANTKTITIAWSKCAVMSQAEMNISCKTPNAIAVGFRRLTDETASTSTTTFST